MKEQLKPPDHKNSSDEELVKLIVQGDEGAFEKSCQQHWAGIVQFAHGVLFARRLYGVECNDMAQETFVVALTNFKKFDPAKGTLRAWLCGITRKLILEQERKNRPWKQWAFPPKAKAGDGNPQDAVKIERSTTVRPEVSELEVAVHQ
jgi:DNA-directed RNA polymerase specialized sigma24 family protein